MAELKLLPQLVSSFRFVDLLPSSCLADGLGGYKPITDSALLGTVFPSPSCRPWHPGDFWSLHQLAVKETSS